MVKRRLLVLESVWSEDLTNSTSVKPFIDGWAALTKVDLTYRAFYEKQALEIWLRKFVGDTDLKICYIAGHGAGAGGRLAGLIQDINFAALASATKRQGPGGNRNKGILIGACEVGTVVKRFLSEAGIRVKWVAGYRKTVPWLEGTMCDLLFLEYLFSGRSCDGGKFLKKKNDEFKMKTTKSARKVGEWVKADCFLAKLADLQVFLR